MAGRSTLTMPLALQVDTLVLHHPCVGVHLHQPLQTRNPQQDADAGPTEPLVRTTCHRLYVRLRRLWRRHADGHLFARQKEISHLSPL